MDAILEGFSHRAENVLGKLGILNVGLTKGYLGTEAKADTICAWLAFGVVRNTRRISIPQSMVNHLQFREVLFMSIFVDVTPTLSF